MLELLLVAIAFSNLIVLGSSRLIGTIRVVAGQGILLGFLPLLAHPEVGVRQIMLSAVTIALKGVGFPWLLSSAMRESNVRHEVEPYIGFGSSILVGLGLLAVSFWLGSRLPLPHPSVDPLVVPVALFVMLNGLLILVTRRIALNQVLGYLVLENGIYLFGVALAQDQPMLVEMGVLLDAFAAVFVMGITIFHINRTFDHIDTDRLSTLREWSGGEEGR